MNITNNLTKVNTHDKNWKYVAKELNQNIIFDISQRLQVNAFSQMKRLQPKIIEFSL
jgi:hypothetical protein